MDVFSFVDDYNKCNTVSISIIDVHVWTSGTMPTITIDIVNELSYGPLRVVCIISIDPEAQL
jgi:hypothetical protein